MEHSGGTNVKYWGGGIGAEWLGVHMYESCWYY